MTWPAHPRVVAARRRSAIVDLAVEVAEGWRLHYMSRNAAVLTYYGFLSIFPLFMVATTVLGFVLDDNPELVEDILDTAVAQIPVIGAQITDNAGELGGSAWTVAVGLLITLWSSTRGFVGLQNALDDAWDVHIDDRDNLAKKRGKALIGIVIIGVSLVAATVLSSAFSVGDFALLSRLLLLGSSLGVNVLVLSSMFRFMSSREHVTWKMVLPGAALGAAGFTLLQVVGATVVDRFIRSASDVAGVFATVFALMAWINLHSTISLVGAELNAAIVRRRSRREHGLEQVVSGFEAARDLE